MDDFSKPKITWASVGETFYSLIPAGFILLDTNYFFVCDNNGLIHFLNHPIVKWWINSKDTQIGNGGAYRHYKYNLEELKIPYPLIESIQEALLDTKMDTVLIYNLINTYYNLSKQELRFIESL